MGQFDFLIVLVSIVIGLGMAELLSSLGRLIHYREQVRDIRNQPLDWLPITWALALFFMLLALWYNYYFRGFTAKAYWPEPLFFLFLLVPVLLSLLSVLVLPDIAQEKSDLTAHYLKNYRFFFCIAAIAAILDVVPLGGWADWSNWITFDSVSDVIFAVLVTLAACLDPIRNDWRKWYHIALAPFILLVYGVSIVLDIRCRV